MIRIAALCAVLLVPRVSSGAGDDDYTAESFQADTIAHIEKDAADGDAQEQYHIGVLYLRGKAVEQNDKKAINWLTKAAEQGYAPAQVRLGTIYMGGYSVSPDRTKAEKWFLEAAKKGNVDAERSLGNLYGETAGGGVSKKGPPAGLKKAHEWFEKAANQGDIESEYHLGDLAWAGWDGKPDRERARSWYTLAAKDGYAPAQYALGQIFFEEGAMIVSFKWFEKAADQSWVPALARVALMREEGRGAAKDEGEAWKWWLKAAEANDAEAQYRVGFAYRRGALGQAKNPTEALVWLKKAAASDERRAELELGLMYQLGEGTDKNDEEGERWIRKAAVQGFPEARRALGLMYADGKGGLSVDRVQACAWLGLATEGGDAPAKSAFDDLRGQLNARELSQVVTIMGRYRGVKSKP